VHDFNAGISHSGLFWTVPIPDEALVVRGQTARLHLRNLKVVDSFTFLGSTEVPATVSFDIIWRATGKMLHFRPESSDPADPHHFAGNFRLAVATGSFSGSEAGLSFEGNGSSAETFGELGRERNGVFLGGRRADAEADAWTDGIGEVGPELARALPNPAVGGTTFDFSVGSAEPVSLVVYDLAGRRVSTVIDGEMLGAGRHTISWGLQGLDGRRVAPGLYLARLQLASEVRTLRVIVLP